MQIELIVHSNDGKSHHMVWTWPDGATPENWPVMVQGYIGRNYILPEIYDDVIEEEEEDVDDYTASLYSTTCPVCGRTFNTSSGRKQHQTVMGHNGQ